MAPKGPSVLLAVVFALAIGAPAWAQNNGLDRRLDRIDQSLRALQAAVGQAQATGQPVVVRPEGPDPVVVTMQQRVNDLEQTLQRINSQLENLVFEVEQAKRDAAAAETDRRTLIQTLVDRMNRLEGQVAGITSVVGVDAVAEASADLAPAPPAPDGGRAPGGTLNGQVQNPPANATQAYNAARALFAEEKYDEAGRAFEDFVARYPDSARVLEAYYWLGESYFARRGYQTAASAYANALKSEPTAAWASEAMARLAQSLAYSNQAPLACQALERFDRTYAARATPAAKDYAQTARTRARCR